jgi:xylan 1,4-beta-xylosidase
MKIHHSKFLLGFVTAIGISVAASAKDVTYSNPVLPGDFPDPSVIRVGDDYWATATTSEWAPLFPLLHSRDLVHWQIEGSVFEQRPDWSYGKYWAPEIAAFDGKFFVYYVGQKKGGPLNIAVATADKPQGPWTDHGPMIGQDPGSIDPVPVLDENGVRYLIWKEDGNSRNLPTPIWAQKLSADGTKLEGEMKELLRNDAPWEGNLIEGPFVVRHGEWFYMFYSGNGCCGNACTYGLGVARAKKLLGPWEKSQANPLIAGNLKFKCPGHGSIVSDAQGRDFLLYHAYDVRDSVFVGRQGLLDEVKWNDNGWPVINGGKGPSAESLAPAKFSGQGMPLDFYDDFAANKLNARWQWPQSVEPTLKLENGALLLSANPDNADALMSSVLAVQTTTGDYAATVCIDRHDLGKGNAAGLYAYGDKNNALGLSLLDGKVSVIRRQKNKNDILKTANLPKSNLAYLRMSATEGHRFRFSIWNDTKWINLGGDMDLEGDFLPPWDRGVRVALTVGGENPKGRFQWVKVINAK